MSEQNSNLTPESTLPDALYCINHPQRETYLRCNRCNDPICVQCAVLTPTGYRCKKCISGQQKVYETSEKMDVPIAAVVAGLFAFGGSFIAPVMSFFTLFIAPLVGIAIEETVRWLVKRRRSRSLSLTIVIASAVGGGLLLVYNLTMLLNNTTPFYTRLLWLALYDVMVTASLYSRLLGRR
ncbi:MAG TPA: hypothetical protein VFF78_03610 [Anaerolineaceae bacterium]|nr:hypothetical protein [Anaerolineaceae bacterium]